MQNSVEAREGNAAATMLKEAGILFAITLVAGFLLAFVHELTKEPIRLQEEKAVQEACASVFASADHFEQLQYTFLETPLAAELAENGVKPGAIYGALDAAGNTLGYVIETTSTRGYGGNIVIYTSVTVDNTINGISFLEISETPTLGLEAEPVLGPQFVGKEAAQFTYTKTGSASESEIDAISGATVTTEAVVNAVNGAVKIAAELMRGGEIN